MEKDEAEEFAAKQRAEECDLHIDIIRVDGSGNADVCTLEEALARAHSGSIIRLAAGEYSWPGKLFIDKDTWKHDAPRTGTFKDIICESRNAYCIELNGEKWEMSGCHVICPGGTAISISNGEIALEDCEIGGLNSQELANNGIVAAGEIIAARLVVRNCKHGVFLRERASFRIHTGEFSSVSVLFGCMIPNDCVMEVVDCTVKHLEAVWHGNTRPASLLQQDNRYEDGQAMYPHGDSDGQHSFQTQDLATARA